MKRNWQKVKDISTAVPDPCWREPVGVTSSEQRLCAYTTVLMDKYYGGMWSWITECALTTSDRSYISSKIFSTVWLSPKLFNPAIKMSSNLSLFWRLCEASDPGPLSPLSPCGEQRSWEPHSPRLYLYCANLCCGMDGMKHRKISMIINEKKCSLWKFTYVSQQKDVSYLSTDFFS